MLLLLHSLICTTALTLRELVLFYSIIENLILNHILLYFIHNFSHIKVLFFVIKSFIGVFIIDKVESYKSVCDLVFSVFFWITYPSILVHKNISTFYVTEECFSGKLEECHLEQADIKPGIDGLYKLCSVVLTDSVRLLSVFISFICLL